MNKIIKATWEFLQVLLVVFGFIVSMAAIVYVVICFLNWHIYPFTFIDWFVVRVTALILFLFATWVYLDAKGLL